MIKEVFLAIDKYGKFKIEKRKGTVKVLPYQVSPIFPILSLNEELFCTNTKKDSKLTLCYIFNERKSSPSPVA